MSGTLQKIVKSNPFKPGRKEGGSKPSVVEGSCDEQTKKNLLESLDNSWKKRKRKKKAGRKGCIGEIRHG